MKLRLDHRRRACQDETWPSPLDAVWERKALPVWVGSGVALVSQLER